MNYTIFNFINDFKTEADCLDFLFRLRYGKNFQCPKCSRKKFYPVGGRKTYACRCGHQVSPMVGTIFHKSPTSLRTWFHAIYLMGTSKNGVAAKELQRHLGVTYKTAWRMGHRIRSLMKEEGWSGWGTAEADETYIGGRRRGRRGRGAYGKTPVFGYKYREVDYIFASVVPNVKKETIMPLLQQKMFPESVLMTDEMRSYRCAEKLGYSHHTVQYARHEYVRGETTTNGIEGFWSQLKRSIDGTHHSVSRKHLQAYVDERTWLWNYRKGTWPVAYLLLRKAAKAKGGSC